MQAKRILIRFLKSIVGQVSNLRRISCLHLLALFLCIQESVIVLHVTADQLLNRVLGAASAQVSCIIEVEV